VAGFGESIAGSDGKETEQMRQMSQITMMSSITTKHENDCGKEEPWISSRREKKKPQGG
jgi:hypothetical protein